MIGVLGKELLLLTFVDMKFVSVHLGECTVYSLDEEGKLLQEERIWD